MEKLSLMKSGKIFQDKKVSLVNWLIIGVNNFTKDFFSGNIFPLFLNDNISIWVPHDCQYFFFNLGAPIFG